MKKGWKIFWIVCGVTFISGLVCCIISLSLGVTTEAISMHFPKGYIGWEWDDDDDDFFIVTTEQTGVISELTQWKAIRA